ncbi:MAG: hypothetical protein ACPGJE_06020, partial [Wenzhouxiangellaceae bacterium]
KFLSVPNEPACWERLNAVVPWYLPTFATVGTGMAEGGRFEFGQFVAGALIAGVFAWITIAAFMAWLRRFGMAPFVIYRLLLGGFLLIWFWPGEAGV